MGLRIIGGEWSSRRLQQPDTPGTRPMPDRVKQAIFSILASRYGLPGLLPLVRVADVFAGSGSMGLEALSRGAAMCTFYESGKKALDALRNNIDALGAGGKSTIVTADAWQASAKDAGGGAFDVMFLDPPYRDSRDVGPEGAVLGLLRKIAESAGASALPLVVLHHPDEVRFSLPADGLWRISDRRSMGSGGVTFFEGAARS